MPGATPFGHIGGVGGYPIDASDDDAGVDGADPTRGRRRSRWAAVPTAAVCGIRADDPHGNGRSGNDVDALVGLLLARFDIAARSFGQTERHMGQTSIGIFINDEWKASSRLTLTAGLRYEVFSPVGEQDNLATNFFPDRGLVQLGSNGLDQLYKSDKNNFGPRAGLAWDATGDGRTSVRAGCPHYDSPQMGGSPRLNST